MNQTNSLMIILFSPPAAHPPMSTSTHSEKLPVVGSPFWMAPEVLRDEPYNEKVGTCK